MNKSKEIQKELDSLKTQLIISGVNPNKALNDAQTAMNKKYGKNWRGFGFNSKYKGKSNDLYPSYYDEHENSEHWMD